MIFHFWVEQGSMFINNCLIILFSVQYLTFQYQADSETGLVSPILTCAGQTYVHDEWRKRLGVFARISNVGLIQADLNDRVPCPS